MAELAFGWPDEARPSSGGHARLSLQLAWRHYTAFESLQRAADEDLNVFIDSWQKTRHIAESVGCHYSDLVLSYKLLEKANFTEDAVLSVLGEIETKVSNGGSVLSEIISYFQNNPSRGQSQMEVKRDDCSTPLQTSSPVGENNETSSPVGENNGGNSMQSADDITQMAHDSLNTSTSSQDVVLVDTKPPQKHCPRCSSKLFESTRNMGNQSANLGVFLCAKCNIQFLVKSLLVHRKELKWEYLSLPRCPKCSRHLKLESPPGVNLGQVGLACKYCQVKVASENLEKEFIGAFSEEDAADKAETKKSSKPKTIRDSSSAEAGDDSSSGANYKCEVCGVPFFRLSLMLEHRRNHNLDKNHQCEYCQKTFLTLYLLKAHIKKHTDEKDFVCSFCGKKFTHRSTFSQHTNIHTKVKSYDCKKCDAKFVHRTSLVYHDRSNHTGEKPYKCEECELSFYTASKLTDHKRSHTGVKPFQCAHCNKGFRHKYALSQHLKRCSKDGTSDEGARVMKPPVSAGQEQMRVAAQANT